MPKPGLKIPLLVFLLTLSAIAFAQKTDKVLLKNGDVLTGEIYGLKLAILDLNMTSTGSVEVKWETVERIISDKIYQVTVKKGDVFVTKLDSAFFKTHHFILDDIVDFVRIKDRFWRNLDGDVGLGFNYTKSSDILQFNFSSSITYVRPKLELNLSLNSNISSLSTDSLLSKNQDATLGILHNLKNAYYLFSSLGWQQNTQLGLANRFILAAGAGKLFINDNHHRLLSGTGLSYNVEQSDKNADYTQNLEALATINFKKFKYFTPKVSIDATYTIYAGITDWGRIRMNLSLNTKYEIFRNFNVGLTFYDNYDNKPLAGAVSNNDYGINFTISYTFGR
jgi:hypothetical protein